VIRSTCQDLANFHSEYLESFAVSVEAVSGLRTAMRQPLSIRRLTYRWTALFRGPNHAERIAGSSMKDRFRSTEAQVLPSFFFLVGRFSAPTGWFARFVTKASQDAPLALERIVR